MVKQWHCDTANINNSRTHSNKNIRLRYIVWLVIVVKRRSKATKLLVWTSSYYLQDLSSLSLINLRTQIPYKEQFMTYLFLLKLNIYTLRIYWNSLCNKLLLITCCCELFWNSVLWLSLHPGTIKKNNIKSWSNPFLWLIRIVTYFL